MPGEFLSGDAHTWREEARSMLLGGELNVPRDTALSLGERGQYFVQSERNGLYYSKFGIVNSLLALPPLWLERALGGNIEQRGYEPSLLLANLWNIVFSVALAALLYALSAAYSARIAVRVLFVIGALYCTALWFYQRAQSSEIYQTLLFTALFMALLGFLRPLKDHGPRGLDARAWRCLAAAWTCAALTSPEGIGRPGRCCCRLSFSWRPGARAAAVPGAIFKAAPPRLAPPSSRRLR